MKRGLQGRYETVSTVGETVKAFIPNPLPPFPALEITGELQKKLDEAAFLLGKLDGSANLLPDVGIFLYMFIRKVHYKVDRPLPCSIQVHDQWRRKIIHWLSMLLLFG